MFDNGMALGESITCGWLKTTSHTLNHTAINRGHNIATTIAVEEVDELPRHYNTSESSSMGGGNSCK